MKISITHRARRILSITLVLIFLSGFTRMNAQVIGVETATRSLQADQRSFRELVKMMFLDTALTESLVRFASSGTDSLRNRIVSDPKRSEEEKAKAIQSIGLFMQGMRLRLSFNKIEWYDLPGAIDSYELLLDAVLNKRPVEPIMAPLSQLRARLLAQSFEHFPEYAHLMDLARYKSIMAMPDDVIKFLEANPGYRYFDSVLLHFAANEPARLAGYLRHNSSPLAGTIRNNGNIYLQEIVKLSGDPDAKELLPFIVELAEKKITKEEILQKRLEPRGYFQLLVNTLKKFHRETGSAGSPFHQALHNAIKEKSISFYVNQLNELHDSPKDVRFASIKDLRMEDIYYIMTSSGNELYTSSYLGLYRRMMDFCKKNSTDSLFRIVHYDKFREFMRIAANYNTLSDFFSCFAEETSRELLRRFIREIEADTYTALEKAMDVADCFAGLASDSAFSSQIRKELESNLERCRRNDLVLGEKLYDILLDVYNLVQRKKTEGVNGSVGYNEVLERSKLLNKQGEVVGLVLFYGDEDGRTSYKNFRGLFRDSAQWKTEESEYWIRISSRSPEPVILYANLPLDHDSQLDLQAQDTLSGFLKRESIEPVILVHRGHSYYINYTLRRMSPSIALAILGACGGNNYILDIASINPDVQMVISKKIGAMAINDPIIAEVSRTLVKKQDLVWRQIWDDLENRFKGNPAMLTLFKEYIPPPNNISIFVLNLFNLE